MWCGWRKLPVSRRQLSLDITLDCGQAFRWRKDSTGIWSSVVRNSIWKLKQDDESLWYNCYSSHDMSKESDNDERGAEAEPATDVEKGAEAEPTAGVEKGAEAEPTAGVGKGTEAEPTAGVERGAQADVASIRDYFNLHVNLEELYQQWMEQDEHIRDVAAALPGVRLLRQDPVENLFSFICSSNNNITRISTMVENLCTQYGDLILSEDDREFHSFPSVKALAEPSVATQLQGMGFGYRSKFIQKSAAAINSKSDGVGWLYDLRSAPYEEAKSQLRTLHGVGAKVADCVCLFSLDHTQAIPVDTHVWQIATKFYLPQLSKNKSLTDNTYKQIGDCFRGLYGEYSGWAHCVLFCGDLKKFMDPKNPKKRSKPEKSATAKKLKPEKSATAKKLKPEKSATAKKLKPEKSATAKKLKPEKSATAKKLKPEKSATAKKLKPEKSATAKKLKPEKSATAKKLKPHC